MELIRRYTREAGVRNLEREISNLARKAVKEILTNKKKKIVGDRRQRRRIPRRRRSIRFGEIEADDQVGLVTGLAWTEVGGELLTIEGVMMPGKGRMTVTGNLKDVMKESISAAASYVRSRAVDFGIEPPLVRQARHPRPRARKARRRRTGRRRASGMATVIVSMLTGIPVRRDIAMTGEITLRGRVLPIGGLKEKLLAALRGGIKKVLIPEENVKDLADIPNSVKNGLEIVPVSRMEEVLAARPRAPAASRSSGRRTSRPVAREASPAMRTSGPRRALISERHRQTSVCRDAAKGRKSLGFAAFLSLKWRIRAGKRIFFCGLRPQTLAFPRPNGEQ